MRIYSHYLSRFIALLLSITLFGTTQISAQEISDAEWIARDTTVSVIGCYPIWKKGDSFKYLAKYEKVKYENDSLISENVLLKAIVSFEIIDSVSDGYIIEYRFLEDLKPKTDSSNKNIQQILKKLENSVKDFDFTLRYKVGLDGSFSKYLNSVEILQKCEAVMKAINSEKIIRHEGESLKSLRFREEYRNLIGTGTKLFENLFAINISNFHNLFGLEMGINDTLYFKESNKIDLLKKEIVSENYLFITTVDTTLNEVQYVIEKYYSPDIVKEIASKAFKKSLDKKEIENLNGEVFIKNRYFFNFNIGLLSYLSVLKETLSIDKETSLKTTHHEIWTLSNELNE
jgi:hypothetical protein